MKEKLIKMYIDWSTGADETLKMSDWLCACFDSDISPDEIEEEAEKILKTC